MASTDYCESCCCARVNQGSVGIFEQLGKFNDVLAPGCYCIGVTGNVKGALSLKAQYLDAVIRSVTADQADVTCSIGIMYRVMPEKCHLAFYRLARPADQIRNFVIGAVRPLVITKTLDALFEERDDLSNQCKEDLAVKMAEFGYEILDVLFVSLAVEGRVRQSMNEQMTQKYNRELAEVQQKTANIRQITLAKANVEVERLEGVGTAEARKVLASAFTGHDHKGDGSGSQASEIEVMSMMLMMQYYDMLRDVKKTLTYFMPLAAVAQDGAHLEDEEESSPTTAVMAKAAGIRQRGGKMQ